MFISFRSSEEAREQASIDKDFIIGSRGNSSTSSIVLNPSISKITPTYKDYLDQLVLEVSANYWKFYKLQDHCYQIILVWQDQIENQKAA
jgi:hypothetical protein